MKTSNLVFGLVAGLAAGTIMGILLAPDKGAETRNRLAGSLSDLGEAIRDRAAAELEKLASLKEDLMEQSGSSTEEVRHFQQTQNVFKS